MNRQPRYENAAAEHSASIQQFTVFTLIKSHANDTKKTHIILHTSEWSVNPQYSVDMGNWITALYQPCVSLPPNVIVQIPFKQKKHFMFLFLKCIILQMLLCHSMM